MPKGLRLIEVRTVNADSLAGHMATNYGANPLALRASSATAPLALKSVFSSVPIAIANNYDQRSGRTGSRKPAVIRVVRRISSLRKYVNILKSMFRLGTHIATRRADRAADFDDAARIAPKESRGVARMEEPKDPAPALRYAGAVPKKLRRNPVYK